MPISYLNHYQDYLAIQARINQVENLAVAHNAAQNNAAQSLAQQIGGVSTQANSIAAQLPNLARGNDVAQLIGGVRSDVGNLSIQISNLPSSQQSGAVLLDTSQATIPYLVNSPARDIVYFLGASDTGGFNAAIGSQIITAATGSSGGILTNRAADNSNVQIIQIDFAVGKAGRTASLTGIGIQSSSTGNAAYPYLDQIVVQAGNSTSPNILAYSASSVVYTSASQWRFWTFPGIGQYRYWSIQGGYRFNLGEIRLYGIVNNP